MLRNGLQPSHIIVVVIVIVLIFGASKLPDIARSVGQSLKIFKKEIRELRDDVDVSFNDGHAGVDEVTYPRVQVPEGSSAPQHREPGTYPPSHSGPGAAGPAPKN